MLTIQGDGMRCVGIIISVLLMAQFAFSATIQVPDDQSTIQAGIDAAANNDTVLVADGTYYEHLLITRDLVIQSVSGAEFTIINGQGTVTDSMSSTITILNAGQVNLEGLTIGGGRGLMTAQMDCARGGGICNIGTKLVIGNCKISGNSAGIIDLDDQVVGGGGIYSDSTSRLVIVNSNISSNAVLTCPP